MGVGEFPGDLAAASPAVPALTELGKRVEMLRIRRALSKQALARDVGISRQQLWRVMTGKSELTSSLRARLADALGVTPAEFVRERSLTAGVAHTESHSSVPLERYLANPNAIAQTLETLPGDEGGRSIKRVLLNAIEDQAISHGRSLDAAFFDLRRRVIAGEL